jgi:hypothetical protein
MLLFLLLTSAACSRRLQAVTALLLLAAIANIAHKPPSPPPSWTAIDTTFGRDTMEFETAERIQHTALNTTATVIVFPEAVVNRWTEVTEAFWQQTLVSLESSGKTMLIGAGLPIPGSLNYRNWNAQPSSSASPTTLGLLAL